VIVMYYEVLAKELLNIRTESLRLSHSKEQSKLERGTAFALNYLYMREKGLHPKDISENMGVSTARVASLINHMVEQGLVRRLDDTEDNRRVLIELTDLGRKRIEAMRQEVILDTAGMLEALGPEDAQEYVRITKKILELSK